MKVRALNLINPLSFVCPGCGQVILVTKDKCGTCTAQLRCLGNQHKQCRALLWICGSCIDEISAELREVRTLNNKEG